MSMGGLQRLDRDSVLGVCPCGVSEVWVGLATLFLKPLEKKPHALSALTFLKPQHTGSMVSQRGLISEISRTGRQGGAYPASAHRSVKHSAEALGPREQSVTCR